MNDKREGLDFDRLGVLTGAMLLTLGLTRLLRLPARPVALGPVTIQLSVTTIMALLLLGLSLTGMESLIRSHPEARAGRLPRTLIHWIVPGLLGMALAIWLGRLESWGVWTLALLASTIPLPLALALEYATVAPRPQERVWVQWGLLGLTHLTALLIFYVIMADASLDGLNGLLLFASSGLLTLRLLWPLTAEARQAGQLAALVALLLAALGFVLSLLPLSGLRAALLLLLGFYVAVGLLSQRLAGRFEQALFIEYGVVAGVGLLALVFLWPA